MKHVNLAKSKLAHILTALPREPATVLNLMKMGVSLDVSVRTGANVYFEAPSLTARK